MAAYPTGVDPFISNPGAPNQYYFNACSVTTAGVRQNCASATQAVAWIQQPSDTLRVTSSNWPQIRDKRPVTPASSLFKTFNPREGLQVQFRFEAFNTFNTPWFGAANTTFGNSLFGMQSATQANDPRQTQVALKILF